MINLHSHSIHIVRRSGSAHESHGQLRKSYLIIFNYYFRNINWLLKTKYMPRGISRGVHVVPFCAVYFVIYQEIVTTRNRHAN